MQKQVSLQAGNIQSAITTRDDLSSSSNCAFEEMCITLDAMAVGLSAVAVALEMSGAPAATSSTSFSS